MLHFLYIERIHCICNNIVILTHYLQDAICQGVEITLLAVLYLIYRQTNFSLQNLIVSLLGQTLQCDVNPQFASKEKYYF